MKIYAACPKKLEARQQTIIDKYRQYFTNELPENKQYWTMCATHTNGKTILDGCELDQMLKSGLIQIEQFHGVDIEGSIIQENKRIIPQANWYCGDFYRTMVDNKNKNRFNPGIVNCDHLKMPHSGGAEYVSRCLAFLADLTNLIFISNLILSPPRGKAECTTEEYLEMLYKYPQFQYSIQKGWQYESQIYVYNGTGVKSKTILGSMVFYKNLS